MTKIDRLRIDTLKIEKEFIEGHQAKIVAEFEADLLEKYKKQAARRIAGEQKIPGFRPGKAPYEVIRRNFGDAAIEQQAIELMLDDVYPKVLEEAGVEASGPGALNDIKSKNPPVFEFTIPLIPEVKLGDYKSIRIDYSLEPVTDKDVDEVLQSARNSYATAVPVERAAKEGDLVAIKIKGALLNPAEGEEPEIQKEISRQISLEDAEEQNSWPYGLFWKELVGMAKDEEKSVTHKFGEDAVLARFANKEVEFHFKVENVKEMNYPEMDDAFAASVGDYKSMQELRDAIHSNIELSRKDEYDTAYVTKIVDKIQEMSEIKYADHTLEHEIEHVISHLEEDLAQQNLNMQTYLKFRDLEKDKFIEEEIKPLAEQRLQRSLILDEVALKEKITLDEKELQKNVTDRMAQLFNTPGFKKPTSHQDIRKLADMVSYDTASRMLNNKVQELLTGIGKGEYTEAVSEKETAEEPAPKAKKTKRTTKKAAAKTADAADAPEVQPETQEPAEPEASA
jgi:trigger factor